MRARLRRGSDAMEVSNEPSESDESKQSIHPIRSTTIDSAYHTTFRITALMRRTPAEEDSSFWILKPPSSPVLLA